MKYKYSPQRNDMQQTESFNGDIITITQNEMTDIFDFTDFPEGAKLEQVETILPTNPIISAKRENGILYIEIIKPHGNLQQGAELPNTDWQEVE